MALYIHKPYWVDNEIPPFSSFSGSKAFSTGCMKFSYRLKSTMSPEWTVVIKMDHNLVKGRSASFLGSGKLRQELENTMCGMVVKLPTLDACYKPLLMGQRS